MKTLEYRWRDEERVRWGSGPWDNEPDKIQWQDENTGLPCLIVRNPMGALCGYVGVQEGHPAFQKKDFDLDVHGGITFFGFCMSDNKEHGVCHVVELGENDRVWWLGFDCAHMGLFTRDLVPAYEERKRNDPELRAIFEEIPIVVGGEQYISPPDIYKTIDYVRREVTSLARQLKELEPGAP